MSHIPLDNSKPIEDAASFLEQLVKDLRDTPEQSEFRAGEYGPIDDLTISFTRHSRWGLAPVVASGEMRFVRHV